MTANGLTIPCTVSRPRYPVHFGGRSAERSLLESWRVVSCLVTVPSSARAPVQRIGRADGQGRWWLEPAGEKAGKSASEKAVGGASGKKVEPAGKKTGQEGRATGEC